jgi:hypothetical protein
MSTEEFLGKKWMKTYLQKLADDGLTPDQMAEEVNAWLRAAISFGCWMLDEGFTDQQWDHSMRSALWESQFDLDKFPKCRPDEP